MAERLGDRRLQNPKLPKPPLWRLPCRRALSQREVSGGRWQQQPLCPKSPLLKEAPAHVGILSLPAGGQASWRRPTPCPRARSGSIDRNRRPAGPPQPVGLCLRLPLAAAVVDSIIPNSSLGLWPAVAAAICIRPRGTMELRCLRAACPHRSPPGHSNAAARCVPPVRLTHAKPGRPYVGDRAPAFTFGRDERFWEEE